MNTEPTTVQWVCECCYFAHHGGEPCDCCNPDDLMKLFGDMEVTSGMLSEYHVDLYGDPCGRDDNDGECDCETTTFTWSSCDGCGSNLGGARYALTGWLPSS